MLIDANLGLDHQDLSIASMIIKEGRGVVFAINKFDLIDDKQKVLLNIREDLVKSSPQISGSSNNTYLSYKWTQY